MMVDGKNFRFGSSLDEVVLFKMIVDTAATKLKQDPNELGQIQLGLVAYIFQRNEKLLRAISTKLYQTHQLRGKKLARLLADVVQVDCMEVEISD